MKSVKFNKKKLEEIILFYNDGSDTIKNLKDKIDRAEAEKKIYESNCFSNNEFEMNSPLSILEKELEMLNLEYLCIDGFMKDFEFKLKCVKNAFDKTYYDMFEQRYLKRAKLAAVSVQYGGLNETNISREVTKVAITLFEKIEPIYKHSQLKYKGIQKFYSEISEELSAWIDD